ncbi:aldose epimerase family protein [Capnocytophaga sp.]|uniref:aldose epimerase family protein n=1 Tax=Capnocytophaga sp. TaxID=44737 RepID=UPI0026DBCB87|nr:aldose epimerase family protein [Capnocytophaga sp.]MDO5105120.1 aldose epimerase family protein [Capnocytophaga sp.]
MKKIQQKTFGTHNNKSVELITLTNKNGMEVSVTNFGGIITSIKVPVGGKMIETVLGFDTFEEYVSEAYRKGYPYLGTIIGRNAGRIKYGKTKINGEAVQLTTNHGENQLHGGFVGFDSVVWNVVKAEENPNPSVTLEYFSKDGEEGYPGNLTATVSYTLLDDNSIQIQYGGKTDKPTILNLTQHTYFNLNHGNESDVLNHTLTIHSDKYVPLVPEFFTPTGEILPVTGTPLDYQNGQLIYEHTDNSFVNETNGDKCIGSVTNAEKTITVEVRTNHAVLHIYAGYYLPELEVKNRKKLGKNTGFCFEAQGFADALNHPNFKSTQLNPDETYNYWTNFKFIF